MPPHTSPEDPLADRSARVAQDSIGRLATAVEGLVELGRAAQMEHLRDRDALAEAQRDHEGRRQLAERLAEAEDKVRAADRRIREAEARVTAAEAQLQAYVHEQETLRGADAPEAILLRLLKTAQTEKYVRHGIGIYLADDAAGMFAVTLSIDGVDGRATAATLHGALTQLEIECRAALANRAQLDVERLHALAPQSASATTP